jgi:molybdate transport system regulatory protein
MHDFEKKTKVWLEYKDQSLLGKGGYALLSEVHKLGSLKKAAEACGFSYRYAWNYIKKLEKSLGAKVVESYRGGDKGGETKLTALGLKLLEEYRRIEDFIQRAMSDDTGWESLGLISARNYLSGVVEQIDRGDVCSKVVVNVEVPVKITSVITTEALNHLGLKKGDRVKAVIKSTEIMIGKQ